jgi:hypothetical protein
MVSVVDVNSNLYSLEDRVKMWTYFIRSTQWSALLRLLVV